MDGDGVNMQVKWLGDENNAAAAASWLAFDEVSRTLYKKDELTDAPLGTYRLEIVLTDDYIFDRRSSSWLILITVLAGEVPESSTERE